VKLPKNEAMIYKEKKFIKLGSKVNVRRRGGRKRRTRRRKRSGNGGCSSFQRSVFSVSWQLSPSLPSQLLSLVLW